MSPFNQQLDLDGGRHDIAPAHETVKLFDSAPQIRGQIALDTDAWCDQATCPTSECVHCQIGAAVEYGHEDEARRRFGDNTVDDWFRTEWGVDPDAMRDDADRAFDARREDGR